MFIPFQLLLSELSKPHQTISKTKQLQALICKTHLSIDPFYATKLVQFYAFNGDLSSTRKVFDESPNRSVYLWNSIIRAYARVHDFNYAFCMFNRMMRSETKPDNFTFACVIRACGEGNYADRVRIVHGLVLACGLGMDPICSSSLVSAYPKLGLVNEAFKVFNGVENPDLPLWNSMVSGYGYCGFWDSGLDLFSTMRRLGEKPDGYTVVAVLSGLGHPELLGIGQGIHGFCVKSSFDLNPHVGSSLVSMYSRCGCLESTYAVFVSLLHPDLVTWSALITGFSQLGQSENALNFFREMSFQGMKPDSVLIASALAASSQMAMVLPGCELHAHILRHGLETNVMVSSALVAMYSKCGFMELALRVFKALPSENIITYNTLISGLGSHGVASQAIQVFDEALEKGLHPDESTFSALLHTFCQTGLVENGKKIFHQMKDEFGIEPRAEHYVHMVRLLGMNGELEEAYNLVVTLPKPIDAGVWGALLTCCEMNGNSALADIVTRHIFENEQEKSSYTVKLSNIYASEGRWDEVKNLRDDMVGFRRRKIPGLSWIGG